VFQASAVGAFGSAAVALCWGLAIVLHRVGTRGGLSRRLSVLLFFEGLALATSGMPDQLLAPAVRAGAGYLRWADAAFGPHLLADSAILALYPLFLAAVLDTPLVRPLARPATRRAVVGAAGVVLLVAFTTPLSVGLVALYVCMVSLFCFALAASIHAWMRAPAGLARTRAGTLALAFGFRDVCWGVAYALGVRLVLDGRAADPEAWTGVWYYIYASGTAFAVPVLAYGILRTQLFDIDLRLRWTIKQSTLAGAFVALLYLVTEGAERLLSSELGNLVGLLAAAALVFFLAPLQRFADKVAQAAMPGTHDTPEYAAYRKLQVYEAALVDAGRGGGITEKERALLERLRDSLAIPTADAEALERDLVIP